MAEGLWNLRALVLLWGGKKMQIQQPDDALYALAESLGHKRSAGGRA